jgi:glucose-1-phosphate cytidylyltransferase
MKVIILAGGYGTRLAEYTELIPKPMVLIGDKPIIWHIMRTYAHFGFKDFYLALGYKAEVIKEYFLNYRSLNADFTVDLSTGVVESHQIDDSDWRVTMIHTGLESMTGGRIKRLREYIGKETFLLTYGDGVADINIKELVKFHKSHGKMVTISAVHPGARFGELEIENNKIISFKEKPQTSQGWINGGYFVIEPDFFDLITGDSTILEQDPLEMAASIGELMAFQHHGYWQCLDTKRDRDHLEKLWQNEEAPWKV